MNRLFIIGTLSMSACAPTSTGFVPIGSNTYMYSRMGQFTDFSGGVVKSRLYQDAANFCADQHKVLKPLNSTSKDSGFGTYASAEIQFSCVDETVSGASK
ncbi:hypothetical protein [Paraburkholderia hospita]|uniref:hypothetical protein n=1 Tax=Paraburkholderia hospita TaxID=169430 RepID=UPI0009D33C92|nr:hypothetical protein [Paraburkholderia hospita]SKC49316.1 hypothetical protein SAMN05446934_0274 [Paraburkholderia hospita]